MVKVREVLVLIATVETPKALAIDGGATTDTVAVLLVAPVPTSVETMVLVVFG